MTKVESNKTVSVIPPSYAKQFKPFSGDAAKTTSKVKPSSSSRIKKPAKKAPVKKVQSPKKHIKIEGLPWCLFSFKCIEMILLITTIFTLLFARPSLCKFSDVNKEGTEIYNCKPVQQLTAANEEHWQFANYFNGKTFALFKSDETDLSGYGAMFVLALICMALCFGQVAMLSASNVCKRQLRFDAHLAATVCQLIILLIVVEAFGACLFTFANSSNKHALAPVWLIVLIIQALLLLLVAIEMFVIIICPKTYFVIRPKPVQQPSAITPAGVVSGLISSIVSPYLPSIPHITATSTTTIDTTQSKSEPSADTTQTTTDPAVAAQQQETKENVATKPTYSLNFSANAQW